MTDDHQLYSTLNGTHRHNSTLEGAPSEMEAEDGYAKINHVCVCMCVLCGGRGEASFPTLIV